MNKKFKEIHNPFTDPEKFLRDEDAIKDIRMALTNSSKIILLNGYIGSGKSSTIKAIADKPSIIGDRYIPVYPNFPELEFASISNESLIYKIFISMKDAVKKYGVRISSDEYQVSSNKIELALLISFLKEINIDLKGNKKILLLFDDLDKTIEDLDPSIGVLFLDSITELSEFCRIIVGARCETAKNIHLNEFFDNTYKLDVEVANREQFRERIVEPLSDVSFDEKSLEKIEYITGLNLYCLKLLCLHIVNWLNKVKRNTCGEEDVVKAADLAISEPRYDFKYFWENLSFENQTIASALADKDALVKENEFYFVDTESSFSRIFTQTDLGELLNSLYEEGYIYRIKGNRFDQYPFKVPLFGYWVEKEHPFIDTLANNICNIKKHIPFSNLGQIIADIPESSLKKSPDLRGDCISNTVDCSQQWCSLERELEKKGYVEQSDIDSFYKSFFNLLELSNVPKKEAHRINLDVVNLSGLKIGRLKETYFFLQDKRKPSLQDIQHISDTVPNLEFARPLIFICFVKTKEIEELLKKKYLNIILLDESDIKDIALNSRPIQKFKELLLSRLSIKMVSPYGTDASTLTFYGRHQLIRNIINSKGKSFLIVGPRKIGKSSLLYKINEELEYGVYVDLESINEKNYINQFLGTLETGLGRKFDVTYDFKGDLSFFCESLQKLAREEKRIIVFLFDEVDGLLKYDADNNYPLLKMMRSLFHGGWCRFIFTGFTEVYYFRRKFMSPLYNFCDEEKLGPLNREAALDLITEPMARISITYKNEDDRERLLKYSSCHPSILQFLCIKIIERMESHHIKDHKRDILTEDINQVLDLEYSKYIINDVYMIFYDLDEISKLIVFMLAAKYPHESRFSTAFIRKNMEGFGIVALKEEIHNSLNNLEMRFILVNKETDMYGFALEEFPKILGKVIDIGEEVEELVMQIKEKKAT